MEKKNHQDFLTALIVGAIGVYAVVESQNINKTYMARPQHGDILTSPSLTPTILGVAIIFCALLLLLRSLKGTSVPTIVGELSKSFKALCTSKLIHFSLLGIAWMALYIFFLIELLGFALSSLIFLLGIMLILQATKKRWIVVISLVAVIAIVVLFQGIFHIRLP
ncbi:MAG: tripartite tricarboxylate transporter TctB family protein [Eubacteriales bacterium]|nr:tripartite tricarboxylate transporter TctB family protein [Eubacteriales bacterium]